MKRIHAFHIELEFESVGFKCWFLRRGENRSTRRKKTLGAKERISNKFKDARIRTLVTLLEGECSHHCATLAPQR